MIRLPPVLYELGLIASLEWLADRMESDHKIRVELAIESDIGEIAHDLRVTLFRAVSELLNNVAKHAQATEATIRVHREGDALTLEVEDNGRGLQSPPAELAADTTGGFGLFSLQERLSSLGGSLEISSPPGAGTRVTVQVPCA